MGKDTEDILGEMLHVKAFRRNRINISRYFLQLSRLSGHYYLTIYILFPEFSDLFLIRNHLMLLTFFLIAWLNGIISISLYNSDIPIYILGVKASSRMSTPIDGNWRNELGSNVTFKLDKGLITGTYQTAVVSNSKKNEVPPPSQLYGSYRIVEDGILLTFAVQWEFKDKTTDELKYSTTSWIGKFYLEDKNTFVTSWTLLGNNAKKDGWSNYNMNQDRFTKVE